MATSRKNGVSATQEVCEIRFGDAEEVEGTPEKVV